MQANYTSFQFSIFLDQIEYFTNDNLNAVKYQTDLSKDLTIVQIFAFVNVKKNLNKHKNIIVCVTNLLVSISL